MSGDGERGAIILCAGIANPPIEPYTGYMPKAFLPIANRPILHHLIIMLSKQGVRKFVIVIGAHAKYFDDSIREELL